MSNGQLSILSIPERARSGTKHLRMFKVQLPHNFCTYEIETVQKYVKWQKLRDCAFSIYTNCANEKINHL